MELLPGYFDSELRLRISHHAIDRPAQSVKDDRLTLQQLRATVPDGWAAGQTVEGAYLFTDTETKLSYWRHPDPQFDKSKYADDEEKAEQVYRMTRIYKYGFGVVAWLGPGGEAYLGGFNHLKSLGDRVRGLAGGG
ncbi:hypothetical protein B0H63DRAFT_524451 [Podospora didyma]|uniref:WW domain-containing protein n=1 Tax=Podospora didyma TaxID=330526 RepID=A0AAE0NHR7_9PEZI|nr:hypothetical protein B0H63DRAFT_524451 [Podospora didyma]